MPVRVGFLDETTGWIIHDIILDSMFLVDIVLTFLTAFESEAGVIVDQPRAIAANYVVSPWFTIDFLSTFPFDLVFNAILDDGGGGGSVDVCRGGGSGFSAVKLLRTVRLVRLAKVMRVLKLQRMLRSLQRTLHANPAVMQLVIIFAFILFFTHLMGCMWFFTTKIDEENNWALAYPRYVDQLTEKAICWPMAYKYLAAIYWAFTTISTIGYGDITPVNGIEQAPALTDTATLAVTLTVTVHRHRHCNTHCRRSRGPSCSSARPSLA